MRDRRQSRHVTKERSERKTFVASPYLFADPPVDQQDEEIIDLQRKREELRDLLRVKLGLSKTGTDCPYGE